MAIYKDYVGLNLCIYDPIESDFGSRRVRYGAGVQDKNKSSGSMNKYVQLKFIHDYSDHQFVPAIKTNGTDILDQSASPDNSYAVDFWANLQGYLTPGINAVTVKDASYHNSQSYMDHPSQYSNTSLLTMPNQSNKTMILLNLHRNGPYGYGSWKQIRASNTPIIRFHKKHSVFTYVKSPGRKYLRSSTGKFILAQDRFSSIIRTTEPVVHGNQHPLQLLAGINYQDPNNPNQSTTKTVELKMSFGNETTYFANEKNNLYFNTVADTDDNYENMKDLYLNGAIDRDDSPIDEFNLLNYKQTVFPREKYAYLNRTRSRVFYQNKFWKSTREDRTRRLDRGQLAKDLHVQSVLIPSQSIWPLDAEDDLANMPSPSKVTQGIYEMYTYRLGGGVMQEQRYTGGASGYWGSGVGYNASGSPGVLQNLHCRYHRGVWSVGGWGSGGGAWKMPFSASNGGLISMFSHLTTSCLYSIPHVWPNVFATVNPSGIRPAYMTSATVSGEPFENFTLATGSLFRGNAAWDAAKQSGKQPSARSYEDFNQDIKLKGQGYSIVPEFRISTHVGLYEQLGETEELPSILELSGAYYSPVWCDSGLNPFTCKYGLLGVVDDDVNATTAKVNNFYKTYSNSDFLKHFELIKNDHNGFVDPKMITLRCKAIKKFLAYDGFYPCQRTVDLSKQFYKSYKDYINIVMTGSSVSMTTTNKVIPQLIMNPLFAPGTLFNSIKSGVAVDYPIVAPDRKLVTYRSVVQNTDGKSRYPVLAGRREKIPDTTTMAKHPLLDYPEPESIFDRIPFEALVDPELHLAQKNVGITDPHPFAYGDLKPSNDTAATAKYSKYGLYANWSGGGDGLYKKMAHNFLAEVPNFFLKNQSFSTITSLESQDPNFGNAESGSFYAMRLKMYRTTDGQNPKVVGFGNTAVTTPQDIINIGQQNSHIRQDNKSRVGNFTMYSRPSAFGPPVSGDGGMYDESSAQVSLGSGSISAPGFRLHTLNSAFGYNYPYTPPYYHGEAWCDLIFECKETKKYTLDEIINEVKKHPYYTRWWWPGENDALRDLTGMRNDNPTGSVTADSKFAYIAQIPQQTGSFSDYVGGPWDLLIRKSRLRHVGPFSSKINNNKYAAGPDGFPDGTTSFEPSPTFFSKTTGRPNKFTDGWLFGTGSWKQKEGTSYMVHPQDPFHLNANALQLNSSLNIFGQAIVKETTTQADESKLTTEVADAETSKAKSRWVIQPKFETPILNFYDYENLGNCTIPSVGREQTSIGMWHQYGKSAYYDKDQVGKGVYIKVDDIPSDWWKGALGVGKVLQKKKVKSLKDLVGFSKQPVKLGQAAKVKQIGEVVAAVPFIEKDGLRQFFTIPREDIDEVVDSIRREVSPGVFVAGGAPSAGLSVVNMVKLMQKYVFPPSMDFVRHKEIDPFAMYLFEFTHNLNNKDLTDIWQNLPPDISTSFEEAEVSISHELLAHELLGGGVQKNTVSEKGQGNTLAQSPEVPSNIQWMVFKVKQRAESNYYDQVVASKGTTSRKRMKLENISVSPSGDASDEITYNWPYDFFSLVELIKIDAEVSFAETEETSQGSRQITSIKRTEKRVPSSVRKAFGKIR